MTLTTGSQDRALGASSSDTRLERAFRMLEDPSVKALSLDVFDTMLWRRVPEPVDAFPLIGARLGHRGILAGAISPNAFAKMREAAELRARERTRAAGRGWEVTLAEIYAGFPAYISSGVAPEELVQIELEVEREILVPDLDVLALARRARELGKHVVAVSDTYVREADLRTLFEDWYTGDAAVDRVFASNEHGVGKTAGLWEIVLRELGVQPHELLHVGDNEDSDIGPPSRLGILTAYFERRSPALERVVEREAHYLDPERVRPNGDAGITALRAKVLHRSELQSIDEELRPFWRFGAACLGPAFAAFADWIVDRTDAAGASRAYCLMREGALLSDLVNTAAAALGSPVSAEPIWLSRHVLARASIVEGSDRELRSLLVRRRAPTVRELCETLGIDADASPSLRARADALMNDADTIDAVIGELTADPELRSTMVEGGRILRERVLAYVKSRVSEGNFVVVDLGWGGTIQALLQRLLDREAMLEERPPVHTIGLYLVTQELAVQRALDGLELEGFLAGFGIPSNATRAIMRSPEILEQVCMPDVGSQVDLTPELEPVLGDPVDERLPQAAYRAAVQQGIRAFQREWTRYVSVMPGRRPAVAADDVRELLLAQLARALVAPTHEEATVFGAWIHDENFGSHGSESITGGPDATRALRHMEPTELIDLPMSELYWPFGLAALADEHLAAATEAVTMGWLPPEAFYSVVEAGDFEVYYDNGFGFGEEWKVVLESKRNRFGLSYARTTVRGDEVRGVRLDPVKAPCLLRIDWIALTCFVRGEAAPRRIVFDSAEALGKLAIRGASPFRPKLFAVEGDDPQFEFDLRTALGGAVAYEVLVECAYGVFLADLRHGGQQGTELQRRMQARSRTVKRFVRQAENRTGLRFGQPLRRAYRRLRTRRASR